MKDYYAVLGLARDATEDDIKRAYRKMAVKWHPDKNPDNLEEANVQFKAIAEAYEVLSDPDKRRLVDSGVDPNDHTAPSGGGRRPASRFRTADPFDIFNSVFGGRDPFADFFSDAGAFGSGFGARSARGSGRGSAFGGFGGFGGSLFGDDDFFGPFRSMSGSGGTGLGSSVFMSTSLGGGGGSGSGVTGRTVTTTTQIVNGQEVVRKVTKVTQPDGTTTETVEESARGAAAGPRSLSGGGGPTVVLRTSASADAPARQYTRVVTRPASSSTHSMKASSAVRS